jgi:hypothetical protein
MTRLAPDPESRAERHAAELLWMELWPDPKGHVHWVQLGKATGSLCRITDCFEETTAFGMCQGHYKRHTRAVANEAARINHDARKAAA